MEPNQLEDRRLVQKLIRYFIFRSIQVILQSRSSKVFRCSCKVYSPQVSLGLSLEDDPSIAVSIKGQFSSNFELRNGDSHTVEIYLCSAERSHERLFLEVWTFQFSDEEADPAIKRMKTFDRLVVALKALWSVSRALPAYRVARRQQTSDRCLMCFNIRRGVGDSPGSGGGAGGVGCDLGSDSRERRIAAVRTAAGRLSLTCCYRPGAADPAGLAAAMARNFPATAVAAAAAVAPPLSPEATSCRRRRPSRCLAAPEGDDEEEDENDENDDQDDEDAEAEEDENDADGTTDSSGSGSSSSKGDDVQPPPAEAETEAAGDPLTDSQVAECFAASADPELVARLKSLNRRLAMFSACGPLASRMGAIPQQLDFFERDLADFDLLLNDILAREDATEHEHKIFTS